MRFLYSQHMLDTFPDRVTGIAALDGVRPDVAVTDAVAELTARARRRLEAETEGAWPEIQAWRRAYAAMGLKPTQVRCASEALLRRLRKDGALPNLHPLIDLCNGASVAYATPVAVFDLDHVAGDLEVRRATGDERYITFSGEMETPEPGEVIFADEEGYAHARRWANRQSGKSAVSGGTTRALIVAEALHEGGADDMAALMHELSGMIAKTFGIAGETALLLSPDAVYASGGMGSSDHVG
ncbi:MAG: phenylalanine--tRNA ligase beta subunit-related protein [Alphaproteobacteria bacterium]|nr:phenylalanine--tRNA ligase beta subunit-related protein [Alphaproteobacteria bacterium]